MKKIITFIVTVLLSLCAFAQSYDIKIYLCKSGESDFLKALKAPSKDIADKFGKLVCSFKISGNQDVSINKIHKFEKMQMTVLRRMRLKIYSKINFKTD